jgi:hypothetical protein
VLVDADAGQQAWEEGISVGVAGCWTLGEEEGLAE